MGIVGKRSALLRLTLNAACACGGRAFEKIAHSRAFGLNNDQFLATSGHEFKAACAIGRLFAERIQRAAAYEFNLVFLAVDACLGLVLLPVAVVEDLIKFVQSEDTYAALVDKQHHDSVLFAHVQLPHLHCLVKDLLQIPRNRLCLLIILKICLQK